MVQAWRRTVTPLLVLALLLSTPSGAAAQWNTNTVASYLALFMVLGSLFFGWAGMYDKNFFVLLGNLACTAGSVVWILMIRDMQGNPSWAFVFVVLGLFNVYSMICVVQRYRVEGCDDSDSDSEEADSDQVEDDADLRVRAPPKPAALADAPATTGGKSSVRKRGKRAR